MRQFGRSAPHAAHRTAVHDLPALRHATRRVTRQRGCLGEPVRIAGSKRLPGSKAELAFSAARRLDFDRCGSLTIRAGVPPQLAPIRIRQFIDGLLALDQGVDLGMQPRPARHRRSIAGRA
ncbi:hypothetical protein DF156_00030 [Burkholderia ubonensis]|nr:hypothetical protein CJO71_20130 [Burkholderia ubonensis]RQP36398.1 hypothetical protein DF155_11140 [Burkholderia ubonensis]RQP46770.1 hypothetical protein DF154_01875 [Burkholderia ubonensis]RQP47508.1 hypothetical protein DF156_00030 [Burkholderia ubonensis]RQP61544.1 hypothetical protein DF151_11885 [Burkholderia ubonensis]